ncbi:MAG: hypothetical protein MI922_08680 [Bacteroidales bacterium]|nr:hypothetical protein [Bacteroidales bacterium]
MSVFIHIMAGNDRKSSGAEISGRVKHKSSGNELNIFGLSHEVIKDGINNHFDRIPDCYYLKGPTPWYDLYRLFNWNPVETLLHASDCKLMDYQSSDIKDTRSITNFSNKPVKESMVLQKKVTNKIINRWSVVNELSFKNNFQCSIEFFDSNDENNINLVYSHTWGKSDIKEIPVLLGDENGVYSILQPGETIKGKMVAKKHTLKIRIYFDLSLQGCIAVQFRKPYKNQVFWSLDVDKILDANKLSKYISFYEDIELTYYTNFRTFVFNPRGEQEFENTKIPISTISQYQTQ